MSRPPRPAKPLTLRRELRRRLRLHRDPEKAPTMQAYMKSEMPYLGVSTPQMRAVCKAVFADYPLADLDSWREAVMTLWHDASHREERYAALELLGQRQYARFRTLATLPLYEELIVTGAWWDLVDGLACNRLGELLRLSPESMAKAMRRYARSRDIWKRRSAILCQLKFKAATDQALLCDCIEPSLGREEFFLRKGIGWALREYAKTDADFVVHYVIRHRERLAPLSKREALKHILKTGRLTAIP